MTDTMHWEDMESCRQRQEDKFGTPKDKTRCFDNYFLLDIAGLAVYQPDELFSLILP